jgi:hypothetical protein
MTHFAIALLIGLAMGWTACTAWMVGRFGWSAVWRNKQALSAQRLGAELARTDAVLESAEAANDLGLLSCLDNGQVPDAKRALIYKLGLFYHRWAAQPSNELPESIQRSLSAIRDAAKDNESVRTVLTHNPKNGPPLA